MHPPGPEMTAAPTTLIHLRGRSSDVVVDITHGTPVIAYWGTPLEAEVSADAFAGAVGRPIVHGSPDVVAPTAVVPEHGAGFPGRPGLLGHRRRGAAWAPRSAASSSPPRSTSRSAS